MAADVKGNRKRAFKAVRSETKDLRLMWLEALNWPTTEAERLWIESEGQAGFLKSSAAKNGEICQFDHVMELQMGGPDSSDNLATTAGKANRDSAQAIGAEIVTRVKQVAKAYDEAGQPKVEQVGLRYRTAEQPTATCDVCCEIDKKARTKALKPAELPPDQERYALKWNTFTETATVPKNTKTPAPLEGSASRVVPGFILQTLDRKEKAHTVAGIVEPNAQMPITFKKGETVPFTVAADHQLRIGKYTKLLEFDVKGASTGTITKLKTDEKGLHAEGTIKPSLPILNKALINFTLTPDTLSANLIAKDKIEPITGVQLIKPQLSILFFPNSNPPERPVWSSARTSSKAISSSQPRERCWWPAPRYGPKYRGSTRPKGRSPIAPIKAGRVSSS